MTSREQTAPVRPYHEAVTSPISWVRAAIGLTVAGVLGSLGGCTDHSVTGPGKRRIQVPASAVMVSDPVETSSSTRSTASELSSEQVTTETVDSVVYVSFPPGTVARGLGIEIRNRATGYVRFERLLWGGLDPVSMPAVVGDSLALSVTDSAGGFGSVMLVVAARRPPVVARTQPPRKKTDVPLNAAIIVVFSEPMSPSTITGASIQLRQNGQTVSGNVSLSEDGLRASFQPAELLAPLTDYQIDVTVAARDLSGEPLGEPVTVPFTTGTEVSSVASVIVTPEKAAIVGDSTDRLALTATARDAAGNVLTGFTTSWTSSDPRVAQVSVAGLVRGLAPGGVTITATTGGQQGNATITVLAAWPAIDVHPSGLVTLSVGDRVTVVVTVTNPAPGMQLTWWASPGILSLNVNAANRATVTATTSGEGYVAIMASTPRAGFLTSTSVSIRVAQPGALVATVTVEPNPLRTLPVSGYAPLRATVRDAAGNELRHVPVTWSASGDAYFSTGYTFYPGGPNFDHVVEVGGAGTITATAGGQSGAATLQVDRVTFQSVTIGPNWTDLCGLASTGVAYCQGQYAIVFDGFLSTGSSGLVAISGGPPFTSITAPGGGNTCGLTAAGTAYCWGFNGAGQLGTETTIGVCNPELNEPLPCSSVPVPIAGGHVFAQISGRGDGHTCGLTAGGTAYCWGRNNASQLGDGTILNRPTPVLVSGGLVFTQISAGTEHTCGLTASGSAYCWGYYQSGTSPRHSTPSPVGGGLFFSSVRTGWGDTCALTGDGAAYCWGSNLTPAPDAVGLAFVEISVADGHRCGRTADGTVYCWGRYYPTDNWDDPGEFLPPTVIGNGLRFRSIVSNWARTCGIATDGFAYCYELNPGGGVSLVPGQR